MTRRMGAMALVLVAVSAWWAAGEDAPVAPATVADLAWLTGSWKGTIDGGEWEAVYTSPAAGEMLSANKEIRGGKVEMIEFEHFRMENGTLVMTPFPFGKRSSASFALTSLDAAARKAVFANPAHDFPREITYQRAEDDRLVIGVVGEQNGQPTRLTLDLRLQR